MGVALREVRARWGKRLDIRATKPAGDEDCRTLLPTESFIVSSGSSLSGGIDAQSGARSPGMTTHLRSGATVGVLLAMHVNAVEARTKGVAAQSRTSSDWSGRANAWADGWVAFKPIGVGEPRQGSDHGPLRAPRRRGESGDSRAPRRWDASDAVHNLMLQESPRLFFMHFWAKDDASSWQPVSTRHSRARIPSGVEQTLIATAARLGGHWRGRRQAAEHGLRLARMTRTGNR